MERKCEFSRRNWGLVCVCGGVLQWNKQRCESRIYNSLLIWKQWLQFPLKQMKISLQDVLMGRSCRFVCHWFISESRFNIITTFPAPPLSFCKPSCTKKCVIPPIKHLIPWDNTHGCDARCSQKDFHPQQHVNGPVLLQCWEGMLSKTW